jgi:integrase
MVTAEFERLLTAEKLDAIRATIMPLAPASGVTNTPPAERDLEMLVRRRFEEEWSEAEADLNDGGFMNVEGQIARHKSYARAIQERLMAHDPDPSWLLVAKGILASVHFSHDDIGRLTGRTALLWGQAQREMMLRRAAFFEGEPGRVFNVKLFSEAAFSGDTRQAASVTMAVAVERYLSNPLKQISPATLQAYRPRLAVITEALLPSKPIAEVSAADCRRIAKDAIMCLPSNHAKKYPGTSLVEAIRRGSEEGAPTIKLKTQQLYIQTLRSFFQWAETEDFVKVSPARNVPAPKGRKAERAEFSVAHLQTIFGAPAIIGSRRRPADDPASDDPPSGQHRFWIPIIALYSGMRVQEIAMLRTRDVICEREVYAFNLLEEIATGRTLKTRGSIRKVPIHSMLIRLGLLDYAGGQPKDGYLFPELVAQARDPGDAFSKWFGRFRKTVGITDHNVVFHSFRHTFVSGCRACGIPLEQYQAIGGWTAKGVVGSYGDQSLAALAKALEHLEFEGLDLTHLFR